MEFEQKIGPAFPFVLSALLFSFENIYKEREFVPLFFFFSGKKSLPSRKSGNREENGRQPKAKAILSNSIEMEFYVVQFVVQVSLLLGHTRNSHADVGWCVL